MKKNTCQIGNVTEAKVLARFVEKGFLVFIPFGEGHKCDLVFIDDKRKLKRVQIKSARKRTRGITINLYSNGGGYNKVLYSKKNIDYFATEHENKFYLIPIEEVLNRKVITFALDKYVF